MGIKLSYSAASRFKQCPQKYYYATEWESPKKPSAFLFGTAIEDGITHMLVTGNRDAGILKFQTVWQKGYGDPDMEYYKSDYDKALVNSDDEFLKKLFEEENFTQDTWQDLWNDCNDLEVDNTKEMEVFKNKVFWYSCLMRGSVMLESFFDQVYPEIEEVIELDGKPACQKQISLKNEHGDEIKGFIDYIIKFKGRDKPVITDAKTASIPYTDHDIETSDQLRTYVTAIKMHYNLDCDPGYMVLGKRLSKTKVCTPCNLQYSSTKRKCDECSEKLSTKFNSDCQLLFTEYTEEILDAELEEYENLANAIDNQINFRNTSSCMAYGRKCEFYDVCWKNKQPEEAGLIKKERKK